MPKREADRCDVSGVSEESRKRGHGDGPVKELHRRPATQTTPPVVSHVIQDDELHADTPETPIRLLRLLRNATDRGGVEAAGELAEEWLRRNLAVSLLQLLQRGASQVEANELVVADQLLEALQSIALARLLAAGWRVVGRGSHKGTLRFRHDESGEVEEEPRLPCQSWEARLLQSLAMLAAPGELNGSSCWCCEVIAYTPCCGKEGMLLAAEGCDHRRLRTVVDVVVEGEDGSDIGMLRQLHAGVWRGPDGRDCNEWDKSIEPGLTLEPWHEVTLAGLVMLLAAASTASCSEAAILIIGVGAGTVASFLGLYAPHIRVDIVEPSVERICQAQRLFGLAVEGSALSGELAQRVTGLSSSRGQRGRRKGSRARADPSGPINPRRPCRILSAIPEPSASKYCAVVIPGPPSTDDSVFDDNGLLNLVDLGRLLEPTGALILQGLDVGSKAAFFNRLASLWELRNVVELVEFDLREDEPEDACGGSAEAIEVQPRIWAAGPKMPAITTEEWHRYIHAPRGAFHSDTVDLETAQRTHVKIVKQVLAEADLVELHSLAERAAKVAVGREMRSAPVSDAWEVLFLQTDNFFEKEAPELVEKVAAVAKSVASSHGWSQDSKPLNLRVAEYHQQSAPGPGLPDPRHYDMDSIVTIDVMLSTPGVDFEGGTFSTLEVGGALLEHSFGKGDAAVFNAHKFHCIAPVTRGCRRVLVMEFWVGPARRCPHRCQCLQLSCPMESPTCSTGPPFMEASTGAPAAIGAVAPSLPFRLGSADKVVRGRLDRDQAVCSDVDDNQDVQKVKILWQVNEQDVPPPPKPDPSKFVSDNDPAWDIF